MKGIIKSNRTRKILCSLLAVTLVVGLCAVPCLADGNGDVAGAVEATWNAAKGQIKTVTNNVIFPALDMILAILFFVKVGSSYFESDKDKCAFGLKNGRENHCLPTPFCESRQGRGA